MKQMKEWIAWTRKNVTEENKEFLRSLPMGIHFMAGKYCVKIVHGSPRRLNEYLCEDVADEYLMELLVESNSDVLVCGHTHIPYYKKLSDDKHVINAGSVGKPRHGDPQAVYVLLEINRKVWVNSHKVRYDIESVARAVEAAGLTKEFAVNLRTGRG